MANWIIPCNPRFFDIFSAYSKLKTIDWNQSAKNIAVGDIVYIYVGKPVQAIMFKTRVIVTDITCDEVDYSDAEFNLEEDQDPVEPDLKKRWMRLELVKRYETRELSLSMLGQYGMKGNIQGPRRVEKGIQTLIDLVDPQDSNPAQSTAAMSGTNQPLIIRTETEQTTDDQPVIKRSDDRTNELQRHDIDNASSIPTADGNPSLQNTAQHRVAVNHYEDNRRIEKKLDSLIGAIATMYSGKSTAVEPEKPKEEEPDRQFRLEPTQGNAPLLMLRKPMPITGLIFTLRLYGIGLDDNSEQYRVFFTNSSGEQLSEAQIIMVVAGGEYNCRFELKSSASEEQTLYLAVQSISAVANEARQLIEFPVKIAFAADFGL